MTTPRRSVRARYGLAIAAVATLAFVAHNAAAHHAFNMYSNEIYLQLDGSVKSYVWKNPHTMIEFVSHKKDGSQQQWNIECSSPNIIGRKGWGPESIKEGDKLHLVVHPMKDGSQIALMVSATLPDGQVLKDKD